MERWSVRFADFVVCIKTFFWLESSWLVISGEKTLELNGKTDSIGWN